MCRERPQAVICGLDGVLVSRRRLLLSGYQTALGQIRGQYFEPADIAALLDVPDRFACEQLLGRLDGRVAHEALVAWLEARVQRVAPCVGMVSLLWQLRTKSVRLALIAPSCRRIGAGLLQRHGFAEAFDEVLFAEDLPAPPPDASSVQIALARLQIEPRRALVLSARSALLASARAAGAMALACRWDEQEGLDDIDGTPNVASIAALHAWLGAGAAATTT